MVVVGSANVGIDVYDIPPIWGGIVEAIRSNSCHGRSPDEGVYTLFNVSGELLSNLWTHSTLDDSIYNSLTNLSNRR